ncbi:MAG: GNAT family N-acetyltransferase [Clostridia bacterium]|jgi:RimJ/RimL family protein N-acetyltransferase|nr:GNAT family N-acetyltransferase [Clostridia bacterium]
MKIETKRLVITELTIEMAQDIHENSLDSDTARFVPDEVFETLEAAQEAVTFLISRYSDPKGPLVYAVIRKTDNHCIGYVQMVQLEDETWEIGYQIGERFRGNGFAAEAVCAFLPIMAERLGIREIRGICLRENAASRRVLEKCGFEIKYVGLGQYQGNQREIVQSIWRA